jgi:ABC-type histidine transport system ATPase subunit
MSSISDRGDSPAFFNEDGSLSQEEDLAFYRDASGKLIFKDRSQIDKQSQKQKTTENPQETKPRE